MKPREGSERLFFALWPDSATRDGLQHAADALLEGARSGGRRVARDRLHLTLHFLGTFTQRPEALVERARAAAAGVSSESFVLDIGAFGTFGPRVWWLGPSGQPEGLMRLRERVGQALVAHDVPLPEAGRAWRPHVTVLRGARGVPPAAGPPGVRWPVRDFVLVHSVAGMPYTVVQRFPLQAG